MSLDTALNKLSPSAIASAIRSTRNTGVSLYVHGKPGISKSSVARQVADELGIAFIDVRLSQMAPEDVRGVPMLGEIDGMKGVLWSPPLFFPRDLDYQGVIDVDGVALVKFYNPLGTNGIAYCTEPCIQAEAVESDVAIKIIPRGHNGFTVTTSDASGNPVRSRVCYTVTGSAHAILALDEFNSAPPSVMAASYQLILDRRLGDYLVPQGVVLLAMGNRDSDKGVTFKLPKPIANRFVHLEMETSFDDWLPWAVKNAIHPEVVGFLSKWKTKLLDFRPETPQHSFATPRSWEFVSKIISQTPAPNEDALRALVCGAIGDAIGTEFLMHRKFMADMPDVELILSGQLNTFRVSDSRHATQIGYSVCMQMLYVLKQEWDALKTKYPGSRVEKAKPEYQAWCERADRAIGYMADHFQPEITILGMRCALLTHRMQFDSKSMQRFVRFTKEFHEHIVG